MNPPAPVTRTLLDFVTSCSTYFHLRNETGCFRRERCSLGSTTLDDAIWAGNRWLEERRRQSRLVSVRSGNLHESGRPALALPETGAAGAKVFGERICGRIAAHEFKAMGRNIRLTVSVGLATFPSPQIDSADDFLARADEALYRAKAGGRNQVWG